MKSEPKHECYNGISYYTEEQFDEALAELERLKKENEGLRSSVRGLEFELNSAEVDKKELKAEKEELRLNYEHLQDVKSDYFQNITKLKAQLAEAREFIQAIDCTCHFDWENNLRTCARCAWLQKNKAEG